jgi:hypothetical protein
MNPRSLLVLVVGGIAAVSALAAGLWKQVGVKSYGYPAGRVVRAGENLAVLIQTRDPYMPSLKGVSESDMHYSYVLWLIPATCDGDVRDIRLAKGIRSSNRTHNIGAQWFENGIVWVAIKDLEGVDVATGNVTSQAPPPALVKAPISQLMGEYGGPNMNLLEEYRSKNVTLASGERLVLANDDEIKSDLKPGARVYDNSTATGTFKHRTLERVTIEPGPIPRVATVTRVVETTFRNGSFMRAGKGGNVVRFANPEGFLVVHESLDPVNPTKVFSRVSADGSIVWTTDTTIGRLSQILWHDEIPAFIGEPPQQLTEPTLSVVHLKDGSVKTKSLKGPVN